MKRSEKIEVRLDPYEKKWITQAAEKLQLTISDYVREIMLSTSMAAVEENVSLASATALFLDDRLEAVKPKQLKEIPGALLYIPEEDEAGEPAGVEVKKKKKKKV